MQRADVYAGYYDANGDAVLEGSATDTITAVRTLGRIMVPEPNSTINFSYAPGTEIIPANPAKLWVTS
ncbi:MAG TPA: hypothetical protein VLF43_04040 [Candidatus Saccharimonadales bacterium]|nr:hypothetical protein [Candidatus Saccharimonadales bacterium]